MSRLGRTLLVFPLLAFTACAVYTRVDVGSPQVGDNGCSISNAAPLDILAGVVVAGYAYDADNLGPAAVGTVGGLSASALYGYLIADPACDHYREGIERREAELAEAQRQAAVRHEERERQEATEQEQRRQAMLRDMESREVRFTHGEMNVRSGPSTDHQVLRTLPRGSQIEVGIVRENEAWARVYQGGERIGYIYAESSLVRASPPVNRTRAVHGGRPRDALFVCRRRAEDAAEGRGATASVAAPYDSQATTVDYDGATRYTIYSEVVMSPGGVRSYTCTLDYVGDGRYRVLDFYLN